MRQKMSKLFFGLLLLLAPFTVVNCNKDKNEIDPGIIDVRSYVVNNEQDLDVLIQKIGNARIVLLGEASHGTSEFYNWRTAITKRLIQEKGFDFMAIEGEWADSYRVNNFVKGPQKDSAAAVSLLKQYDRWPTWMWGNYEVASLVTWLNQYNQQKTASEKVGFFGLDVYCLWESMTELMPYIQTTAPALVPAANQVHQCFQPFSANPETYANAVAQSGANCRQQTNHLWQTITSFTDTNEQRSLTEFVMEQNALVALNGEKYYRVMATGEEDSWNVRDRHMTHTLQRLLQFHGSNSKAIVWEHNTHVGDARYTDMANEGLVNVGQLVRETYGEENVFIVGFGTYEGSVIAASAWGAPIQKMKVPAARKESWEYVLHQDSAGNKLVFSEDIQNNPSFHKAIGNRAIGVVYNPGNEAGNYVPTIISQRYDAFFFIDKTNALHPIAIELRNEPPDTYPSGY
ncbi:MAG: erythromycin esterase family protein [Bacteroidota bacterium]